MIDVRIPADPQDFQTSNVKTPRRPRDFYVRKSPDGTTAMLTIRDWQESGNRATASGYKVYFAEGSVGTAATIGTAVNNAAAFRTAVPIAEARATFRGGLIEIGNSSVAAREGWFYCVSFNQDGQESEPNGPVPSPWNQ